MKRFNFKSKQGFTLIELLVVIGILAVLAAIAIPSVAGLIDRANVSADATNSNEMTNAVERFVSEYELYVQDIASGRLDTSNLDSAQGRVYNVTGVTDRAGIEALEKDATAEPDTTGKAIYRDTKYPVNAETMQAVVENYMKTSSSTFTPKQSDMHYWYSPDCGVVVFAESNADQDKENKLNAQIQSGMDAKGNQLNANTQWIDLTDNASDNTNNSINQELAQSGFVVPEGAEYIRYEFDMQPLKYKETERYVAGEIVPNIINPDDRDPSVVLGGYDIFNYNEYSYKGDINGWEVSLRDGFGGRQTYGEILTTINGANVVSMYATFKNQTALTVAPVIPNTVTKMNSTFYGCSSLTNAPVIPDSVDEIPYAFQNCSSLITAPAIPQNVYWMENTFYGCSNLSGTIVVHATNPTLYSRFLKDTQITNILGSCSEETKNALLETKYH